MRHLVGAQIDLLPPLMVYASLSADLVTVALLALFGGFWFDSLSGNPLGLSVLPLFLPGSGDPPEARSDLAGAAVCTVGLGLGASAATPLLALLLLLTMGQAPLLGWGTLWQLVVLTVGGAVATPLWMAFFAWLGGVLVHNRAVQSSFRSDREIRRGDEYRL